MELSSFSQAVLRDRYLLPGETPNELFKRVASTFADDTEHADRIERYMNYLWFMPATPVLSNAGNSRGFPISCFLNTVDDSLESIESTWSENVWLAARGGGIGTSWSDVRAVGEKVGLNGQTSGIIPFIKVQDSLSLAISQGSLRRGSAAAYLDISHPEVIEFLTMRKPSGGDPNRKALNLHHGLVISDAFMEAVEKGTAWDLRSPLTGDSLEQVDARRLWSDILTTRMETGEPYMLFIDTVNRSTPPWHEKAGLRVGQSNLCSEITLPTNSERTAVCCLSSVNLDNYDSWKDEPRFIEDIMRFLDNVLQNFIDRTEGVKGFEKARYSAMRERSVGLGVMGFHSYLQRHMVPFEGEDASRINREIFSKISAQVLEVNHKLGAERGPCPDAADWGFPHRFSYAMAIAPTANISIISNSVSPGIDPHLSNSFSHKTLSGRFQVRNHHLERHIQDEKIWQSILLNDGQVDHLNVSEEIKQVFKTADQIEPMAVIRLAAERQPYICQSQSVNLFLPPKIHKKELHKVHFQAWKMGLKSLYYCRTKSLGKVDHIPVKVEEVKDAVACEACQ